MGSRKEARRRGAESNGRLERAKTVETGMEREGAAGKHYSLKDIPDKSVENVAP